MDAAAKNNNFSLDRLTILATGIVSLIVKMFKMKPVERIPRVSYKFWLIQIASSEASVTGYFTNTGTRLFSSVPFPS